MPKRKEKTPATKKEEDPPKTVEETIQESLDDYIEQVETEFETLKSTAETLRLGDETHRNILKMLIKKLRDVVWNRVFDKPGTNPDLNSKQAVEREEYNPYTADPFRDRSRSKRSFSKRARSRFNQRSSKNKRSTGALAPMTSRPGSKMSTYDGIHELRSRIISLEKEITLANSDMERLKDIIDLNKRRTKKIVDDVIKMLRLERVDKGRNIDMEQFEFKKTLGDWVFTLNGLIEQLKGKLMNVEKSCLKRDDDHKALEKRIKVVENYAKQGLEKVIKLEKNAKKNQRSVAGHLKRIATYSEEIKMESARLGPEEFGEGKEEKKMVESYKIKANIRKQEVDVHEDWNWNIEMICDYDQVSIIGKHYTFVAVRDATSFLIGTFNKGIVLMEKDSVLYEGNASVHGNELRNLVYADHIESYFICVDNGLYLKKINKEPAKEFLSVRFGHWWGRGMHYCKTSQRLIVDKEFNSLAVINIEKKKIDVILKFPDQDLIIDFQIFSRRFSQRTIAIQREGRLTLHAYDGKRKMGKQLEWLFLDLDKERTEEPCGIAVCPRGAFALIELRSQSSGDSSRFFLYQINDDKFSIRCAYDNIKAELNFKWALRCDGYFEDHLLWIGMTADNYSVVTLDFDQRNGEMHELRGKRTDHLEDCPMKIEKFEDSYYYIGRLGKLMKMTAS